MMLAAAVVVLVVSSSNNLTNWTRPAEFDLSPNVVYHNPGPFTATMAGNPANTLFHAGGFEPLMLRRRFLTENGTSGDTAVISIEVLSEYDSWRDGWLDRASVRVYRVVGGKFNLVRNDTIKRTRCSDWNDANSMNGQVVTSTTFYNVVPPWFRPGTTQWFTVVAVDRNGNYSSPAPAIQVQVPVPQGGDVPTPPNTMEPMPKLDSKNPNATVPPVPTGLTVKVATDGVMTFTWSAVKWPSLAGYVIKRSEVPPEEIAGSGIDLEGPGTPMLPGDLIYVERKDYTYNRTFVSSRIWNAMGASNPSMLALTFGENSKNVSYNGENDGVNWNMVQHPTPLPEALTTVAGETCAKISIDKHEYRTVHIASGAFAASSNQSYYPVLDPEEVYVMEVWARADNPVNATTPVLLSAGKSPAGGFLVSQELNVTNDWQHFQFNFTTPWIYNTSGAVQSASLKFSGAGASLYLDNWRCYTAGAPFVGLTEVDEDALKVSGLGYIRTHAFIKSTYGYDMESLTNSPGVTQSQFNSGPKTLHTLSSMFGIMLAGSANPWLQVEQFMSERELLGLVEYLAAPFDANIHDVLDRPWAAKRAAQGQAEPYTDVFDSFIYEVSNEQWNGMFAPWTFSFGTCMPDHDSGETLCDGELAGIWQEKTIAVLQSSPYWTSTVNKKFKFVVGGWASSDGPPNGWHNGFGTQAVVRSPTTSIMNIAGYNGGWDAGEAPAVPTDDGFFKALSFTEQNAVPTAAYLEATKINLSKYNSTYISDGTYEAGPGYNMNGLNNVKMNSSQVESESQVMKSLAAGTATLDSFLARAIHGFAVQNFFTFSRNRYYWSSHAPITSGGQAYPSWKALSLYNVNGTGDFLNVTTMSVPTAYLPGSDRRSSVDDAPMVAVYATRVGNRVNVFILSRKLNNFPFLGDDGYTQCTVHLPFTLNGESSTITRYRLSGPPRANNLDHENVQLEIEAIPGSRFSQRFVLSEDTGADDRGLPPGAIYMYAFEGVSFDHV